MVFIASCPECGGVAKWQSPFYVCTICGLALRRREYERMHDRQKDIVIEAQLDKAEEETGKKQKRNREYLDWYLGSKK